MTEVLNQAFNKAAADNRAAFIPYITAGYPTPDDTVPLMLALQDGGSDIIELGVPFSDPMADGPTIQKASFDALKFGITLDNCLDFVRKARSQGLRIPVVLMTYYNPFVAYGEERLVKMCSEDKSLDVAGFIVVDMDQDDFANLAQICKRYNNRAMIPLVAPTTTDERLEEIAKHANGYTYCVSVTGVTGARKELPKDLKEYCERVGAKIKIPRAVGFGLSTHDHFKEISENKMAEGVVMGSKVINIIKESFEIGDSISVRAKKIKDFTQQIISGSPNAK